MLVAQETGDVCCSVALGGAGKKPDKVIHQLLRSSPKILLCLDYDDAGIKAYIFWKRNYLNLVAWPVPNGKSPEEAHRSGIDLRSWVREGMRYE